MEIELKNVSKTISGAKILKAVSMELRGGRIYGLKGINGSGKTMLMRAMLGLIRPTSGEILVDGKRLGDCFPNAGFLIENPAFLGQYTGYTNLMLLAKLTNKIGGSEVEKTLKRVGLAPEDRRKFRKYSLGMKQKLGIAAAVMEKPDLVVLDEPFNALDEASVEITRKIILEEKARGAIVVLACHDGEMLENLADEIYLMEEGRLTPAT